MRASVPALILALLFVSPAYAEGIPRSAAAPRLAYVSADRPAANESGCGPACAPRLAYAFNDPTSDWAPTAILAASAPAAIPALGPQPLPAVDSEEPSLEKLAGLVTIAAAAPAAMPIRSPGAAPAPGLAPVPAPAPVSDPGLPACVPRQVCP
jgi:hypothetical protein